MICKILSLQLQEREMKNFDIALLRFIGSSGKNCKPLHESVLQLVRRELEKKVKLKKKMKVVR